MNDYMVDEVKSGRIGPVKTHGEDLRSPGCTVRGRQNPTLVDQGPATDHAATTEIMERTYAFMARIGLPIDDGRTLHRRQPHRQKTYSNKHPDRHGNPPRPEIEDVIFVFPVVSNEI